MEYNDITLHRSLVVEALSKNRYKIGKPAVHHIGDFVNGYKFDYIDLFDYIIHRDYNNFRVVHYNPRCIYENMWDEFDGILRHCRGLVIDTESKEIVLLPYDKFFNLGEREETSQENIANRLQKARNVEFAVKMDGSLICTRWYKDQLVVATSGTIGPNNFLIDKSIEYINSHPNYLKLLQEYKDYTFMFEYIFQDDPHIVIYSPEQQGLYLHGMRNVNSGQYIFYSSIYQIAKDNNILCVNFMENATLDSIKKELKKWKHDENEGYVMNIDGFFVKLKCEDYIQYAGVINGLANPHKVMDLYISGELKSLMDDLDPDTPLTKNVIAIINEIEEFKIKLHKITIDYYNRIIIKINPGSKKEFYIALNKDVPKDIRTFVAKMYEENNDIWHTRSGHQMTYTDMQNLKKKLDNL